MKCGEMLGQFLGLFPLFLVRSNCPTVICSVFSMLIPDILVFFNATTPCIFSQKNNNSACQKPPQRYEAWFFIQRITGVVASITPNVAIPKKSLVLSGFCGL